MHYLCKSTNPEFQQVWRDACNKQIEDERIWVKNLRSAGIKAAHPNDGWVDRDKNTITLMYPQFNDNAGVGSLIMLGWPGDSIYDKGILIRLIKKIDNTLGRVPKWRFNYVYGKYKTKREWLNKHGAAARTIGWFMYGGKYFDSVIPDRLYFK